MYIKRMVVIWQDWTAIHCIRQSSVQLFIPTCNTQKNK